VLDGIDDTAGSATAREMSAEFIRIDIFGLKDAPRDLAPAWARFGKSTSLSRTPGSIRSSGSSRRRLRNGGRVLGINLQGVFNAARSVLPVMRPHRQGYMLFTSSITGPYVTNAGYGLGAASKSVISGFIKAAALEFCG